MPVPGTQTPKVALTAFVGCVSDSVQFGLAPALAQAPPQLLNGMPPLVEACSVIGVCPYEPLQVAPQEMTGVGSVSATEPVPVLLTATSDVPMPLICGATEP